ncbi:MAG: hypothetical protein HOP33_14465 [Verrucomicrobia bacterium]|nr:hypothetical protein [Verrucomicrobiota bacterium]
MLTGKYFPMTMFGFKSKKDEVLNHWISFADNFTLPSQEFYQALEKELAVRNVPGLEISKVEYAEGGLFSEQRVYLRLIRERLAFDACAAPFGTGYFFSCRTVYSPVVLKLWHLLAVLVVFGGLYLLLAKYLGIVFAGIAVVTLVIAIAQVFRNAIAMKIADLDAALLKMPIIGPIYEKWFRVDSYYREDTRMVYLDLVPKLVQTLAEEVTAAKGVKLVRQYQRAPVLGELYKPHLPSKPGTEE